MHIAWGPFIPAALTGGVAVLLYITGWLPRAHGIFTALTAMFLAAGTGLLALAHRAVSGHPNQKVSPGPLPVFIILGAALFIGLFVYVVICGNHGKPLMKMRRRASGGGGAAAGAGGGSHPKAAHHRSAVITVGALAFAFLLVFGWGPLWQLGTGGLSQTGSSITSNGGN